MAKKAQKSREEQIRDLLVGEAQEFVQERTKFLADRIAPEAKKDFSPKAKRLTELALQVGGCQSNNLLDLVEAIVGEDLPRPAGNKGGNFFVNGAVFAFAKNHPSCSYEKGIPYLMLPSAHRHYGNNTELFDSTGSEISIGGNTPRSKAYYRAGTPEEVDAFVASLPTHTLVRIMEYKVERDKSLLGEEEE